MRAHPGSRKGLFPLPSPRTSAIESRPGHGRNARWGKDDSLGETVFFVSDTHFKYDSSDEGERAKRERFLDFLARIEGCSRLYLVGDIFDFWFEYRSVVPRYYHDILLALSSLRAHGTEILIAGGNHDYWLGPYLSDTLGFTVLPTLATHELQGLRITMTHGDTLLPRDLAYKTLKGIIRSAPVIAAARLLHPDALFAFAKRFSRASKGLTEKRTERTARSLLAMAERSFFRWGNDVFIMGHVHYPCLERFGGRTFVILGDWERSSSYLELREGHLSLGFYSPADRTPIENR
jgi:UDP-2,3-diacylglucosamine hydrolase